jgi:hypothetical protein
MGKEAGLLSSVFPICYFNNITLRYEMKHKRINMMKNILIYIMMAGTVSLAYAFEFPVFKLSGYIQARATVLDSNGNTGVPEYKNYNAFCIAVDSGGTGINISGFRPLTQTYSQTPLSFIAINDFDVHTTLFKELLYTGIGIYSSSDFLIQEKYVHDTSALAGTKIGKDDNVDNEATFGYMIKVNPLKCLSFAAYVPVADGNFTGYGDSSTGTVGYKNRSAEDAYSNIDFAVKYAINGIGTVYTGAILDSDDYYVNFDYTGIKNFTCQTGFDYNSTDKSSFLGAIVGYQFNKINVWTQDQIIISDSVTELKYGAAEVAYQALKFLTVKIDADIQAVDLSNGLDTLNVIPAVTLNNSDWMGPVHDVTLGFAISQDLSAGSLSWSIPLTISILVL